MILNGEKSFERGKLGKIVFAYMCSNHNFSRSCVCSVGLHLYMWGGLSQPGLVSLQLGSNFFPCYNMFISIFLCNVLLKQERLHKLGKQKLSYLYFLSNFQVGTVGNQSSPLNFTIMQQRTGE